MLKILLLIAIGFVVLALFRAEIQRAADQHQHGHEGVEQDFGQRYDGKLLPEQPLVMVCHRSMGSCRCGFPDGPWQAHYRFEPPAKCRTGLPHLHYQSGKVVGI
ncbi:MAG: hypothetical protein M1449_07100 [Candidatus Thermoplasmatota archaeon]|nr:hypothetical protein [Candidatus Thermoplasmatota archaeon]